MAEYETALIRERTAADLVAARARGRHGGRKPKMTPALINKAQRMYDSQRFTMAEIAQSCQVTHDDLSAHPHSPKAASGNAAHPPCDSCSTAVASTKITHRHEVAIRSTRALWNSPAGRVREVGRCPRISGPDIY